MKLLDKIKNAIFEDDEFEEEVEVKDSSKNNNSLDEDIVKKIDIEKTIPKRIEINEKEEVKTEKPPIKREARRTPIIFNEEDLVFDEPKKEVRHVQPEKEEVKKPLYGGYRDEKTKGKFKPSPIISPVYGLVGVGPVLEHAREDMQEKHIFVQNKKEEISLDSVRQKAFGEKIIEEDDDLGLLYEMRKEDDTPPAISKITLGDAEEYFEDLGLEYNIDYKDDAKEKELKKNSTKTRTAKNKDLADDTLDNLEGLTPQKDKIKEKVLESTKELEITKEQLKPKTAKEIKKVTKIEDADLGMNSSSDNEEAVEKNLYDLIDMMYDSK